MVRWTVGPSLIISMNNRSHACSPKTNIPRSWLLQAAAKTLCVIALVALALYLHLCLLLNLILSPILSPIPAQTLWSLVLALLIELDDR